MRLRFHGDDGIHADTDFILTSAKCFIISGVEELYLSIFFFFGGGVVVAVNDLTVVKGDH